MRIILAGLWVALMLTYLLGDVLRISAGDFVAGGDSVDQRRSCGVSGAVHLAGLPYPGKYDNFLIFFGSIFNAMIVWYAWRWTVEG